MSAFVEMLERVGDRAAQEWQSQDRDTLPNPLAGPMGPRDTRYNPPRNVPLLGGLINRTATAPLHVAGLVQEGGGESAEGLAGLLTGGVVGSQQAGYHALRPDETPSAEDQHHIDAFNLVKEGRLGRANDAAKEASPLVQTIEEMATNPLNLTEPIGALGQDLAASGKAPALGRALRTVAEIGEASNRVATLPLVVVSRARAALLDRPEFLRPLAAIVESESRPALLAAQAAVPDNAAAVEALGKALDARGTLRATLDDIPDGDMLSAWLRRDAATRSQGEPGAIERTDWLRATLPQNLEGGRGRVSRSPPR